MRARRDDGRRAVHGSARTGVFDPLTRSRFHGRGGVVLAAALAFVSVSVLNALPWLRPGFAAAQVLGVAVPLALIDRLRGWRGELVVFASAAVSLAIAFHWAPSTIAAVLDGSKLSGWLFAIPILAWDAARVSLPLWLAARVVWSPRSAWLPVGLAAVACEGVFPAVFPWRLGYSQVDWPPVIQSADLFGPAAATFAVCAAAGVVTEATFLTMGFAFRRRDPTGVLRRPTAGGLAACAVVAANLLYGAWAIGRYHDAEGPTARVVLVQADPDDPDGHESLAGLTRKALADGAADLVVWPECSGGCHADSLDSFADPDSLRRFSRGGRPDWSPGIDCGCPLLFGAEVFSGRPEKPSAVYRSAILVDRRQCVLGTYHKRWLMPFGEYVPAAGTLPALARRFGPDEPLATGTAATPLDAGDGLLAGVLMCYEDMLPEAAASLVRGGATLLVSLVNAASFPHPVTLSQHRMLAQLRAVETRRTLVRCAATGETCVIDPAGGIVSRLPLHERGTLAADVPILAGETLATRIGPLVPVVSALAAVVLVLMRPGPVSKDRSGMVTHSRQPRPPGEAVRDHGG
jgi:apolipoprotein N-acyltransferase